MTRTPLLRPKAFFERRASDLDGVRGVAIAAMLSLAVTAVAAATLRFLADRLTGTTTVDNPARPPDAFCGDSAFAATTPSGGTPTGCDLPATKTVEIGSLFWDAASGLLPWLAVGFVLVWFLVAVGLYAAARVAGGEGRFGATLELTAWGLASTLLASLVGAVLVAYFASRAELAVDDPERLVAEIRTLRRGTSGLALGAVRLLGAGWQAYVWAGGLQVLHGLNRRPAWVVAVVVALVPTLLSA